MGFSAGGHLASTVGLFYQDETYSKLLNCNIEDLSIQQLKECSELIEDDIFSMITPEACVNVRTVTGGPSEKSVENQIVALTNYCNEFSRK